MSGAIESASLSWNLQVCFMFGGDAYFLGFLVAESSRVEARRPRAMPARMTTRVYFSMRVCIARAFVFYRISGMYRPY